MKKKHFNIPVLIPEAACPFQCIYCNQKKITGASHIPDQEEINKIITDHLSTIPENDSETELAFFGGNFTGLPDSEQRSYLSLAKPFLDSGRIIGIRLSTRPDYINKSVLQLLKSHRVTTIELGAQSFDNEVLQMSKRGHTSEDTEAASKMILNAGFRLGLQMMIGLPGDTPVKSLLTAHRITELGASQTRIYPVLVIKGTSLEKIYLAGDYKPLSLEEAINWSKLLFLKFESAGIAVIRMGLHPSDGIHTGKDLVAGPFHPSFRELVLTEIWSDLLTPLLNTRTTTLSLRIPSAELNYAIGYGGKNRKMLLNGFRYVNFIPDKSMNNGHRRFIKE
jgi:histone acetyltransferase (RNA polymerase elongator complex component)